MIKIEEIERTVKNNDFYQNYLDKEITLFVDDKDRVHRRDGILRGIDHTHYHLEITYGPKMGHIVSFLRTDVKRIELKFAEG